MQLRMYVPIDEDEGAAGANACSRGMHYTCTRPSTEREREREREAPLVVRSEWGVDRRGTEKTIDK